MRLRSLLATVAAGALVGSAALSAAPAEATAPPVLFGLISPWGSNNQMTTQQDDNQLGIHSAIIGSFFHWGRFSRPSWAFREARDPSPTGSAGCTLAAPFRCRTCTRRRR